MSQLAGILRVEDATLATQIPPTDLTTAVNQLLRQYESERNATDNFLVAGRTTDRTRIVKLGGADEGQKISKDGRALESRTEGQYEVGFPLDKFAWAIGWNYEDFAYMTVADLDRVTASRTGGNAKRHNREKFRALFNNANGSDADVYGSITVRRLANQDGTLYPPAPMTDGESEQNNYIVAGFTSSSISATNNPFALGAAPIRTRFGTTQAVVAVINSADRANVLANLTTFIDVPAQGVAPAPADAQPIALTGVSVPGDFIGVDSATGVYVYVFDRVPQNYMFFGGVGLPQPLEMRIPSVASLQGFVLEAEEEHTPFFKREYVERFGYGVANRLSAAIVQLKASGSYDVPSLYA